MVPLRCPKCGNLPSCKTECQLKGGYFACRSVFYHVDCKPCKLEGYIVYSPFRDDQAAMNQAIDRWNVMVEKERVNDSVA